MARISKKNLSIEEQYKKLLDLSPLPVAIHINGLVEYVNKAGLKFIGAKSLKEVYGKQILKFIHPEYQATVVKRITELMRGKKESNAPVHEKFIRRDGTIRDVEIASMVFDFNGTKAVQSTIRDITKQKEFENKLQQSNNNLEAIIRSSPQAIYVIDTKGRVLVWNTAAEKIFGWKEKEVLGKVLPIAQAKKRAEFKMLMKGLLEGKAFTRELVRYRKDGSEINVFISATPLYDATNKITSIVAITTDISYRIKQQEEREQYIEKIKLSETRYRTMIEQSPLSTQILSPNGITIQVNKAWEKLWGLKLKNLTHYNILQDPQLEEKGLLQYIKNGFAGTATEIPPIKYETDKTSTLENVTETVHRWVKGFIYPIKDEKGTVKEIVLIHEDITDQKEIERQKDDFIAVTSHELKTPVTSIKAYAQILQKKFESANDLPTALTLKKMDDQISKMSNLIYDLLDVTKLEGGRLQFNNDIFDIDQLIEDTVEEVRRTSAEHTITFKGKARQKVFGDKFRIAQVITNLLTNAMKYSPDGKPIIISARSDAYSVIFCVQDFGVGIPKDKREKIFDRFYRVSGTKEDTYPGLGLGLYISSEIVKHQGGKIWVRSQEGKGSTFFVSLPISQHH